MMATKKNTGTMILPSASAAAIWEGEIAGQISDGMWENSTPHEHWVPWQYLKVVVIPGVARVDAETTYFQKTSYNLRKLLNIGTSSAPDYCIRDRMVRMGRMGLAIASLKLDVEQNYYNTVGAAEYMPGTYEEWASCKTWNAWEHMELVSDELARAYYDHVKTYGVKEMKADLDQIKAAMRTAKSF